MKKDLTYQILEYIEDNTSNYNSVDIKTPFLNRLTTKEERFDFKKVLSLLKKNELIEIEGLDYKRLNTEMPGPENEFESYHTVNLDNLKRMLWPLDKLNLKAQITIKGQRYLQELKIINVQYNSKISLQNLSDTLANDTKQFDSKNIKIGDINKSISNDKISKLYNCLVDNCVITGIDCPGFLTCFDFDRKSDIYPKYTKRNKSYLFMHYRLLKVLTKKLHLIILGSQISIKTKAILIKRCQRISE